MTFADRTESTASLLRAAAEEARFVISGDGRICERDAAKLLGLSWEHLKALRDEGKAPPVYRRGVNGSRLSYRICDLAAWVEDGRG